MQFVDNLSDSLNTAAGDASTPRRCTSCSRFPGALIALGLAYLAALGTVERDRRDLALLRARGARRRDLLVLASLESVILGIIAGLLGTAAAFGAVSALVTGGAHATTGRVLLIGAICVLLASAGAGAARIGASLSSLRMSVASGRRGTRREHKPLWQRLYLDVACLVVSGLIYWLTASTGFSAVVNPDSNPTLSLSVYMFFAPALLWIGATLLLVRLRGRALSWIIARVVRGRAASRRAFLLVSAGRRGAAINRGLVVVGLLLAFGVNLGIFSATYNQQVKVDAQLTLGADVTATAPPGVASERDLTRQIAAVPGVAATTGVEHSYAYVGPDLQDTYGIDASSFGKATSLRDSYFLHSTAQQVLDRLRSTRDGIVVSKETITDFSLKNRRPAAAAGARPADRAVPRRSVPRGRDRAGVSLGAQGLLHGRQPRLPGVGDPRGRPQRRVRQGQRLPAGCRSPCGRRDQLGRAPRWTTSPTRARARAARSPRST